MDTHFDTKREIQAWKTYYNKLRSVVHRPPYHCSAFLLSAMAI